MLWYCASCTCAYSVGAPCCPQCGSAERDVEDAPTLAAAPPAEEKPRHTRVRAGVARGVGEASL